MLLTKIKKAIADNRIMADKLSVEEREKADDVVKK